MSLSPGRFLSALGVIAEQPQLIEDILITKQVLDCVRTLHNNLLLDHMYVHSTR